MANVERLAPPKDSIGGTAASMILGMSKYGSMHRAYRKILSARRGVEVRDEFSFPMYRGTVAEDHIVNLVKDSIEDETGFEVVELPGSGVLYHNDYGFIHATVDRLLYDRDKDAYVGVLEVKSHDSSFGNPYEWGREDHAAQVSHYVEVLQSTQEERIEHVYMVVAQADSQTWSTAVRVIDAGGDLSGFSGVINTSYKKVETIENYRQNCIPRLVSFWEEHVLKEEMPPLDGTKDCAANIKESIPSREGVWSVNESDIEFHEIDQLLSHMKEIEAEMDVLKSQIDEIRFDYNEKSKEVDAVKSRLKVLLGDKKTIDSDRFRITASRYTKKSSSLDKDRLMAEVPEVYNKYLKKGSEIEKLLIKIKDKP
tara:strand:+ start:97 stop:1200 length:1104 start_codon:yes stop_codon:yes gene_type:complete